jgi:DNA-binding XRE family transcriptional regulator
MPVSILGPRSDVASAEQVRAAREERGWTLDEMADAVHASPLEVAAWEAGTVRVPPLQAARIRRQIGLHERMAAVAAAGFSQCDWAVAHAPGLYAELCLEPRAWLADPVGAHVRRCAACKRVRAFARTLPRLPEDPDAPTETTREAFWRLLELLPRGTQFAILILGGTVAAITGFVLVEPLVEEAQRRPWQGIPMLLAAYLSGGIVMDVMERPLLRALWRYPSVVELLKWAAGILAGLAVWRAVNEVPGDEAWMIPAGLALSFGFAMLRMLLAGREREPQQPRNSAVDEPGEPPPPAPSSPVPLLTAPSPVDALDGVVERRRAEHAGGPVREGA